MTDADIIEVRKSPRAVDHTQPFADSIAFARAVLAWRDTMGGHREYCSKLRDPIMNSCDCNKRHERNA